MKGLFIFLFLALFSRAYSYCDIAPEFWCDTKEIAVKCGVVDACAERLWVDDNAEPVRVDLYFESLCPGCRAFLTQMFFPTFQKFMKSGADNIMKVGLIPYGNAHETQLKGGQWNYTCQHGPDECTGNLIDNCILKYSDYDMGKAFPIIYCIEVAKDPISAAKKCVLNGNLDWNMINKCASGEEGNALMHKSAVATDKLKPKHQYVPWIVVNGVHTDAIQQQASSNLEALVCKMYKGTKPAICDVYMKPTYPFELSYSN